jgi:RHS repeat-associated protein
VSTNANGNITSIPPANQTTAATFAYNVANRLASVTGSPTAATFLYDAFGQRFAKTSGGTSLNLFTYGQDSALLEESNSGVITDYLYADGRPIATLTPSTDAFYYLNDDRLGTPQLATDLTQTPQWQTTYQPYGTTPTIVSGITQSLRLPGQHTDLETGFNYNLSRDYMPNIGRYLETDPAGLHGGTSTYGYTLDNPLKFIDPSGLASWNLLKPGSNEWAAEELYNPAGVFSVSAHGESGGIYDFSTSGRAKYLTPLDFEKELSAHGYHAGDTIVLHACNTGSGIQSFAQQLASDLGVTVIAPDNLLASGWAYGPGGAKLEYNSVVNGGQFWSFTPWNSPAPKGNTY